MSKFRKSTFINGLQVLKSIYAVKRGKRIPLYCEWEVTDRCNMNCSFCGTRKDNKSTGADIPTKAAVNLIDQLSGMGTRIIHFSGGEPTLRDDLNLLIARAKEKKMLVSLTTNGSAPAKKRQAFLMADIIAISIDGDEQLHDSMRKAPGAYRRAVETLKFLTAHNKTPIIIAVCMENSSYEMLERLATLARSLKVKISVKNLGPNVNTQSQNPERVQPYKNLDSPYFKRFASLVEKLKKTLGKTLANPGPLLNVIQNGGLGVYGCRAMDIAISLKADGSVSLPCNGLTKLLIKGDLREAYYGKRALKLRAVQGIDPVCKGCSIPCMVQASALLKPKGIWTIFDAYIESLY